MSGFETSGHATLKAIEVVLGVSSLNVGHSNESGQDVVEWFSHQYSRFFSEFLKSPLGPALIDIPAFRSNIR